MVRDQKELLFIGNRVQVLYKTVSKSTLDLTDVGEATLGAVDAVDRVDRCAGELLFNVEDLFGALEVRGETKGVAMGTRMDPSNACLFVGYVKQSLFRCYTGLIPDLFLRYSMTVSALP
eukprot:g23770.t1